METILVGIDDSAEASRAADVAAGLAAKTGATLVLAHISSPVLPPLETYSRVLEEAAAYSQKSGEELLERTRTRLLPTGVPIETMHVVGGRANELVGLADQVDASIVVVGTRDRGTLARTILGSVADHVVHTCKRPVLVVR